MHAIDQTCCILCPGLAREYNSDLGVDHWTLAKIKDMFLDYGGDKKVHRKGLRRCKF